MVIAALSALESATPPAKYCICGSYLIAIVISKSQCVENMVARLGIGVKGNARVRLGGFDFLLLLRGTSKTASDRITCLLNGPVPIRTSGTR